LPWGKGRPHLNQSGFLNEVVGDWSGNLTFFAQTGNPFTVYPNNSGPSGAGARAILIANPFKAGGTPNSTNPGVTCATKTRNLNNWYNPCSFANPPSGTAITSPITDPATVLSYLGGVRNSVYGPGYERINMSLFKDFPTWREEYLEFRGDIFNVLNTPAYGTPNGSINSNGGEITSPRFFQNYTPDARFFQFALKYAF
jgi:hypothetical protein